LHRNPFAPPQTPLLGFEEQLPQPCNVTSVYLTNVASGIYGLGTVTTRPDDLGPRLAGLELGLTHLCSPIAWRPFGSGRDDELALMAASQRVTAVESVLPPAMVPMRELLRWIGGSADALAGLLGASRRSIYNWLNGKPVRGEFAVRTMRLRTVLAPLGEEWHPEALAEWLKSGSPARDEFARQERWLELEEEVRGALTALLPQSEPDQLSASPGPPEPLSSATLIAVLEEFGSPPPVAARPRGNWRPRELTGSTPGPDEG
jgi:hypothetical protein